MNLRFRAEPSVVWTVVSLFPSPFKFANSCLSASHSASCHYNGSSSHHLYSDGLVTKDKASDRSLNPPQHGGTMLVPSTRRGVS